MAGQRDVKVERPKKGMALVWTAAALALLAGVLVGWFARDFFAVNACLDAGGAWAAPGVCVGAPPR